MPPKNKNTILNPATGRHVLKSGTIGRRLVSKLKDPQKPDEKTSNPSGRRGPKHSPSDSSEYSSASRSSDCESDQSDQSSSEQKSDGQTTEGESDFTENDDSANDESDETSNNNSESDHFFDENEQSADDDNEDDIEDDVLIKSSLETKDISLSGRLKPINPEKRVLQQMPGFSVATKKRLMS